MHARMGTHESVGVVKVSTEGMSTLLKGQAPTEIDRFKAWTMDERYHAVSHVSRVERGLVTGDWFVLFHPFHPSHPAQR